MKRGEGSCAPCAQALKAAALVLVVSSIMGVRRIDLLPERPSAKRLVFRGEAAPSASDETVTSRLRLVDGLAPERLTPGALLSLSLQLANDGAASLEGPLAFTVLLRGPSRSYAYREEAAPERMPRPGATTAIELSAFVPKELGAGEYDLLLRVEPLGASAPLRLGNRETWEETTGLNRLNHKLRT